MFLTPEEIKSRGVDESELHPEDDGNVYDFWERKAREAKNWDENGASLRYDMHADIQKHGVQRPVELNIKAPHNIIDGHHRVASAKPGSLIPVTYEEKWWDDNPNPNIVH